MCDVAGRQFGKPLVFTKERSHLDILYFGNNIREYILNALIQEAFVFHLKIKIKYI